MIFIEYLVMYIFIFLILCLLNTYVEEKTTLKDIGLYGLCALVPIANVAILGVLVWFSIEKLFNINVNGDTIIFRWSKSKDSDE